MTPPAPAPPAPPTNGKNGTTRKRVTALDCERVRYLAATLDDWAKAVRIGSAEVRQTRGETADAWKDCPKCGGQGYRRERGIPLPCDRCQGRGLFATDSHLEATWQREIVPDDPDLSLAEEIAAGFEADNRDESRKGLIRADRRKAQDETIERIEQQARERAELEAADDSLTRAVGAKERQWRHGSYAELVTVLERMRVHEHRRYRDFVRFCVGGLPIHSARTQARVDRLVVLVAMRLPRPIRVPAGALENEDDIAARRRMPNETSKGERDANIRRLYNEEGWKQSRIARRYSLSQSAVSKIVAVDGEAA